MNILESITMNKKTKLEEIKSFFSCPKKTFHHNHTKTNKSFEFSELFFVPQTFFLPQKSFFSMQTPKKKKSFHGFILPPYHNYTYLFTNQTFGCGKIICYTYLFTNQTFGCGKIICQSYHKLTTLLKIKISSYHKIILIYSTIMW